MIIKKYVLLIILSLIFLSCGKDKLTSDSQSSSSPLVNNANGSCKMINGGALSGCCSSHGGAKNCGTGLYLFNSANVLVCNDGTLSPTCPKTN